MILVAGVICAHLDVGEAESRSIKAAKFASNEGNWLFLGLGMGINLIEDSGGLQMATRSIDSVVSSSLLSELLKKTTHEKRPDGSGHSSFPSGHATAAFAAATMQSEYHPIQTPLWVAGASLIAASRVKLHRHYVHDVLAGALLGSAVSEAELYRRRGLLIFPLIEPESHSVAIQAMLDW